MLNFIAIVMAIVLGNAITFAVAMAVVMNEKFLKWYTREVFKVGQELEDELDDLIWKV